MTSPIMDMSSREAWAREILAGETVTLHCSDHGYGGSLKVPPARGCQKCWMVFYTLLLAKTPPSKRMEKLDMLLEMVHKAAELISQGKWDFKPYEHPEITIERDVPDSQIEYIN